MRYQTRNQLLELLSTIAEGINYMKKTNKQNANAVAEDCSLAFHSIRKTLNESLTIERFSYYEKVVVDMEEFLQIIINKKENNESLLKDINSLKKMLNNLGKLLKKDSEVKLEILFLPYKFSMWDSLESIWLAAKEDVACDCYVMPIPYYERDEQGKLAKLNYEGEQFIENKISIISSIEYDIAKRRPDIIYFHNPYDGNNFVTSVSPEYYSDNLKNYTDMLVYVPYFIAGPYENVSHAASLCRNDGVLNADKIILQSEILKKVYIENGIDENKIAVLGSPKIDAGLKKKEQVALPTAFEKIVAERKVILLNSSIGSLLSNKTYMEILKKTVLEILGNRNLTLIWRPHPLLESTVKTMRPKLMVQFNEIKNILLASENGILDETPDASMAILNSDGMITDYSSLIQTYIMSGKPVLVMDLSREARKKALLSSDIFSCYFNDEVSIKEFLDMLINNEDPDKEKRVNNFKNSVVNANGNCGSEVHIYIMKEIMKLVKG